MRLFRIHGYTDSGEQVTVAVDLEELRVALAREYIAEDNESPDNDPWVGDPRREQETEYRRMV